jgi:hypothetical protein
VGAPSAFSITLALLPSVTTTQELVVPRSIPIAFGQEWLLRSDSNLCGDGGGEAPRWGDHMRDAWAPPRRRRQLPTRPATAPAQAAFLASACGASLTSIFFGMDLAGFGIVILRTPLAIVAWMPDGSMPGGNFSIRMNIP